MTSPTGALASWRHRKRAYVVFTIVAVTVAGLASGYAAIASTIPPAITFAGAFLNVVGAGLGLVAASNGPVADDEGEGDA